MKRFIDLRHASISGCRFAWWDTVLDQFESHDGAMAWDTWDEFEQDYEGPPDRLNRYRALCPEWAVEPDNEAEK